ncbi:hypothetical protein [Siphonobacter sp. SORGH_AS_0500]|uniref:hypothetical protein n=1 Tax=Siphonobacter sp. SORGH_AS_0500 TaxID=1864824 RepID=UPI00285B55DD|nr:hypothetical protein [Siphonobacter sp. SORGH_AS_0500]MDR6195074.1 hypothetical protein [Siphonobacter sp. SORGH_AS_0500]
MNKILIIIFRTIGIIVLLVLPFFPITENFFPPEEQVDNQTFGTYVAICIGIVAIGTGLIFTLKKSNPISGWLFFAIGMTAIFPLHLGPPRMDGSLLTFAIIEQFRYGLLLLATLLLFFGGLNVLTPIRGVQPKTFFAILIVTILFNLWDNYSSFMLSSEMKNWVAEGKSPNDFSVQFNFQITWRTLARIGLYLTEIILTFILLKQLEIKKWQLISLSAFCIIGIIFCILCLLDNFENFYFPFMVPAIALAPAYWLGIALLTNKKVDRG